VRRKANITGKTNDEEAFAHTRTLSDGRLARNFEGVWYAIETAPIPGEKLYHWQKQRMKPAEKAKLPRVYDVLKRVWVSRFDAEEYVTAKTQLGKKDLKLLPTKWKA
jgi:hypothetical protein